ncbi:MAG: FAD-binding domain-containing protein, partial [Pseudomonadota bacterium]
MQDALSRFPPNRTASLERLQRFVPLAGRDYAARRNYDLGRDGHMGVSTLSPYLRARLITEEEVLTAVLARHSASTAEKFVQEVFWRTYWKGWLELRPSVWTQYQSALNQRLNEVQTQSGLRVRWEAACLGQTDITCFNAWAQELTETGYLHNHARMWFASIWIFTLRLPWELGADFFLRHLLDGDPASNTLGWRWVAGIQTPGKTYLARTSNISKYTEGRFAPKWQLAGEAIALEGPPNPPIAPLPDADLPIPSPRTGLILHDEDL